MLNGGTNNDLSSSQVVWTWSFCNLWSHPASTEEYIHLSLFCIRRNSDGSSAAEFLADETLLLLFFSNTSSLSRSLSVCRLLVVSNAQRIGFYPFLLLISHLYTWVDRSSSIRLLLLLPPPPSAASCERDSCENSVESVQPGGGKKPGALLLHLPILTRFSRDIRGNKRLRSKAPPDNFWTASPLHLKCGDTDSKPVHEFAFVVAVFSIRNKRKTF